MGFLGGFSAVFGQEDCWNYDGKWKCEGWFDWDGARFGDCEIQGTCTDGVCDNFIIYHKKGDWRKEYDNAIINYYGFGNKLDLAHSPLVTCLEIRTCASTCVGTGFGANCINSELIPPIPVGWVDFTLSDLTCFD